MGAGHVHDKHFKCPQAPGQVGPQRRESLCEAEGKEEGHPEKAGTSMTKSSPAPRTASGFKVEKFIEQKKTFFFLDKSVDKEKYLSRKNLCTYI